MNTDQTNATPLIPCPFCISTTPEFRVLSRPAGQYAVGCIECGAWGPLADSRNEAIVRWNTRANITSTKSVTATPRPKLSPEDAAMLHELAAELGALDSMPVWLHREIEGGMKP